MKRFLPTKAFITGASSGIGKELALLLAERKVQLILVGRDTARLQEVVQAISDNTQLSYYSLDLNSSKGCRQACEIIYYEVPDLIVNAAGVGFYGDCIASTDEELQEIIDTNCKALVSLSRASAQMLKESALPGVICNLASVIAYLPCPKSAVYAASKAFVLSFSQALDYEMLPFGIRVLATCPGQVATRFQVRAARGLVLETSNPYILSAKQVARSTLQQIERRQQVAIIDWKYRCMLLLTKILPQRFVSAILSKSIQTRLLTPHGSNSKD
jgi:short-subunit dehydrogenase